MVLEKKNPASPEKAIDPPEDAAGRDDTSPLAAKRDSGEPSDPHMNRSGLRTPSLSSLPEEGAEPLSRRVEPSATESNRPEKKSGPDAQGGISNPQGYARQPSGSRADEGAGPDRNVSAEDADDNRPAGYGASNKVFTADAAERARATLRSKLSQLNSGIDPEILQAGLTLAVYHIEAGTRAFADYSRAMVEDLGEEVRPFLRTFYEAVRHYPGIDGKGMTPTAEIDAGEAGNVAELAAPQSVEGAPREELRATKYETIYRQAMQDRAPKMMAELKQAGILDRHVRELGETALRNIVTLGDKMRQEQKIPDDFMERVRTLNQIHRTAEEIVIAEMVEFPVEAETSPDS